MSESLRPHGQQQTSIPCPSLFLGVCWNSCPLSQSCHPTISSCHPLLVLPSIFPIVRVFSNESALHIKWPKYWSFSLSISPFNEYSGLISFRIGRLDLLTVQGTLKSLLQHTVRKHQFFGAQPSLRSNSKIYASLLEKPYLWLYGPFLAKWCLCFLIGCLGLL